MIWYGWVLELAMVLMILDMILDGWTARLTTGVQGRWVGEPLSLTRFPTGVISLMVINKDDFPTD